MGGPHSAGKGDAPRYHENYKKSKLWCNCCGFVKGSDKCKEKCNGNED